MKIETLKERIEKLEAKIEKKHGTIAKKNVQITKKQSQLAKLGYPNFTRKEYYEQYDNLGEKANDIYWTLCDIETLVDDIERNTKEIEATEQTLEKYRAQLAGEIEKESIFLSEIPESMKRMQTELVMEWDAYDKERRQYLKDKYEELGYTEFFKKFSYAAYEFRYLTDEQIHESNERDAKLMIMNLYYRVKDVTGEVVDWTGIHCASSYCGPVLNGVVIGKEGRASVESILAGGYNIQRLHVRVLVHEI